MGPRGAASAELAAELTIPMMMPLQKSDTAASSAEATKRTTTTSYGMTKK